MSYPGVLLAQQPRTQQYYTEQPHQQPHFQKLPSSEAIEMRPRIGFSRLPQDPPVQPQLTNQMETTMANGTMTLNLAPDYKPPPSYIRDENNRATNPFMHQHNYEELPFPRTESSTDDVVLKEIPHELQRQGSQAEVDQYFNRQPVHSISTVPLTISESAEKQPRKKVNPIYDRYQGPAETITKTKDGSHKNLKFKGTSSVSLPVRCLRHPITTVLIFALVTVVIVALVLLMLGTIETPGLSGTADKQVQSPTTTPGVPDPEALALMIQQQSDLIETLKSRVATLENMLGGSEVNASLNAKVAVNTMKIDNVVSSINTLTSKVGTVESTLSNTLTNLDNTNQRTLTLMSRTQQLNTSLGALNAVVVMQGTSIHDNTNKNNMQDVTISTLSQDLSNLDQKFGYDLNEVNRTIFEQLEIISKMPGPRGYNGSDGAPGPPGPRGAGDLSQCEHKKRQANAGFGLDFTDGPIITTPTDKVITGFSCSSDPNDGDVVTTLHSGLSGSDVWYQCKCNGGSGSSTNTQRNCNTHYWQCPKNS